MLKSICSVQWYGNTNAQIKGFDNACSQRGKQKTKKKQMKWEKGISLTTQEYTSGEELALCNNKGLLPSKRPSHNLCTELYRIFYILWCHFSKRTDWSARGAFTPIDLLSRTKPPLEHIRCAAWVTMVMCNGKKWTNIVTLKTFILPP